MRGRTVAPRTRGGALLYDADCGFCGLVTALVLTWDQDRLLRPVALQSPEAGELVPGLSEEERLAALRFVGDDGKVHAGGEALASVLRALPGGTLPARALGAVPRLTERAYRLVADNRDRIGPLVPGRLRGWATGRISERAGASR